MNLESLLRRLGRKKGESTYREYERHIRYFDEWFDGSIFDATGFDIDDNVGHMLDQGYSVSSIYVRRAALSEFYKESVRAGLVDKNPIENSTQLAEWKEIKDREKQKKYSSKGDVPYLSPEEVGELAKNAPKPTLRNELIIRMLAQTGMRRGEICQLKLNDGTWGESDGFEAGPPRTIRIRGETTKSGESRVVGWRESLDWYLQQWLENYRHLAAKAPESEYLFPTSRSEHIDPQVVERAVKVAAEKAGIQSVEQVTKNGQERMRVTPHILRHSFAMACIDKGWDIYALKEALGHSSVDITESTYLHDAEEIVIRHFEEKGPAL